MWFGSLFKQDGYTALTLAAKDGHIDIVYQLLQKGAYVNLPDRVCKPLPHVNT